MWWYNDSFSQTSYLNVYIKTFHLLKKYIQFQLSVKWFGQFFQYSVANNEMNQNSSLALFYIQQFNNLKFSKIFNMGATTHITLDTVESNYTYITDMVLG